MRFLKLAFTFLGVFFGMVSYGQVINQTADWGVGTSWTLSGNYDPNALFQDPTQTNNFGYSDDIAGGSSIDNIAIESPVIDLTQAYNAGEMMLLVNLDYIFEIYLLSEKLTMEYYDADNAIWVVWKDFEAMAQGEFPATTDYVNCTGLQNNSFAMSIDNFTSSQLTGFKYRISFDDDDSWGWGFCCSPPTISTTSNCISHTISGSATAIDLDAFWGVGTCWSLTGSYTSSVLFQDPTQKDTIGFDDDAAGSGVDDNIEFESSVLDLTPAYNANETTIELNISYVFRNVLNQDKLALEYFDADVNQWILWGDFMENSTSTDYKNCTGLKDTTFNLLIDQFTSYQLAGFKYRIAYDDFNIQNWGWGFCMTSPQLRSLSCNNLSTSVSGISSTEVGLSYNYSGNPTGGFLPYTHTWTQIAGTGTSQITNNNDGTATVVGDSEGTIVLKYEVTDSQGCSFSSFINITATCSLSASISGNTCLTTNSTNAILDGNPMGGSGSYTTHTWTQIAGTGVVTITNNNDGTANIVGTTSGTVEMQYEVTDSYGCSYSTAYSVLIHTIPPNGILTVNSNDGVFDGVCDTNHCTLADALYVVDICDWSSIYVDPNLLEVGQYYSDNNMHIVFENVYINFNNVPLTPNSYLPAIGDNCHLMGANMEYLSNTGNNENLNISDSQIGYISLINSKNVSITYCAIGDLGITGGIYIVDGGGDYNISSNYFSGSTLYIQNSKGGNTIQNNGGISRVVIDANLDGQKNMIYNNHITEKYGGDSFIANSVLDIIQSTKIDVTGNAHILQNELKYGYTGILARTPNIEITNNSFTCIEDKSIVSSFFPKPTITHATTDMLYGIAEPFAEINIHRALNFVVSQYNCFSTTPVPHHIDYSAGNVAVADNNGLWELSVSQSFISKDYQYFAIATGYGTCPSSSEFSEGFIVKEDICEFAKEIQINSDPCDNNGVQIDFKDLNPSSQIHPLTCDGGLPPNNLVDAWYKITVSPTGNCLIRTNGDNTIAPVLEVFTGDCNTLTQVQCGAIDTPPYAMVLSNYQPGTELYISIWDRNNAIVNSSSDAILSITAHELSSNPTEWQICDQSNNTFGNPTNLSQQDLLNYILEFDDNTPQDSVLAWQTDAIALGDSLVDECACGGRTLQLWGVDNLIDLEERRQSAKNRARVDTSNYNYIFEDIEFQVNDYSIGRQDKVDVDMDNEGNFAMVWVDSDRKHNYGRVYNSSGNPISSEIQIGLTNKEQASASITMKEDGSFTVVWHEKDITNPNTQNSVFLRHFDAEGTPQGTPIDISLAAANNISAATDTINKYGYGILPQIDTDINGNYMVAWNVGFNIYFQLFDSSDNFIGTIQTVNDSNNSSFMSNVDVSMNDSGAFIIAWNGSGNGLDIWAKRFDSLGNPVGNTFKINSVEGNDQTYPAIDLANDGTLTATWQSLGIGFFNEILWNQFDSNNTPVNAGDQLANTVLAEDQLAPDVKLFDNGDFMISWSSYHEHASTNSDFNIYARLYNSGGSAYDPQEFRVNTISSFSTDFEQSIPKLACNGENIFINAWVDRNGDTNYEGIFAQRYEVLTSGGNITDYYPIGTATPSTLLGQELVHPQTGYIPPPTDAAQVRVAVIDTGIDENHPFLSNALWNNQEVNDSDNCVTGDVIGYDFINETGNPTDLAVDGHGTKVNGIVARDFDNSIDLDLMNLKFHELSKGKVFDAVCAIYYAVDNGAEVMNLSWGFEASENPAVLRDALLYASDNDVLIVTTAGNTSKNNDIINKYPANLDIPNMIVVTSYTIDNQTGDIELSNYASYGANNVDIAAHGFVETTEVSGTLGKSAGTSLAAPAVTRTAATIRGLYPNLTAADIKDCILSTADVQTGLMGLVATNGCLNHTAAIACAQTKNDVLCSAVDLYISTPQSIDSTYRSDEYITSDATLSNTVDLEYLAADSIMLDADFCVPLGAEFLADIEDCDPLNNLTGNENDAIFRVQEHSLNSGKIKAQFQAKAGEQVTVRFMNNNKQVLDEWQATIPENGDFEKIINVHRLPAGLYYVEYTNGEDLVEKAVQIE